MEKWLIVQDGLAHFTPSGRNLFSYPLTTRPPKTYTIAGQKAFIAPLIIFDCNAKKEYSIA